jgi:glycosyltransferase involved in cell wall biosynthesis
MKVLLLNQAFYPDVVATAQYSTELATRLAIGGHKVTVIASARGYDNPEVRFSRHERFNGVNIVRIKGLALGKRARWRRALDFASFFIVCAFRLLTIERHDVVLALTSPPLISFLAAIYARVRGCKFVFWIMDLNPDEAVAAGWLRRGSVSERALARILKFSLDRSDRIVVLDRFMKDRIIAKGIDEERLIVIPPWANERVRFDLEGRLQFRERHNLTDKFVVMYAGNHSPCHPLDTLLEAALALRARNDISFCFVGGGSEVSKVKGFAQRHELSNILHLPYQRLSELAGTLSAGDLHAVVMGERFVGLVHPSKIYNVLAVGKPVMYVGPAPSHITDLFIATSHREFFQRVDHGDCKRAVDCILRARERRTDSSGLDHILNQHSINNLLPQLVTVLECSHGNTALRYRVPEAIS